MKSDKLKGYLFYFLIVVVILLSIYVLFFTKSEGYKCMLSPLTYGVSKLQTSNNQEITCSCHANGVSNYLLVTKDNISIEDFSK